MTEEELTKSEDNQEPEDISEKPLSEDNKVKKWDVKNPKGRVASVLSLILWSVLLIMLIVKDDWNIGPILMAVLFVLLLALSGVRFMQEWKENGDWLDD